MTDEELERRLDTFRQKVEAAQIELGVASTLIYSAMTPVGTVHPVSVIGGETIFAPGRSNERTVELRMAESVTLLGYVWSRLEVLKREAQEQFGPHFASILRHEMEGNLPP